jgi:hypothetical protein
MQHVRMVVTHPSSTSFLPVSSLPKGGAVAWLWPLDEADLGALFSALDAAHEQMTVYLKEDIPERYHHQFNRRIAPILVTAESGWYIQRDEDSNVIQGQHGFDPCDQPVCNPLFLAGGPAFKNAVRAPSVRHIDIYALVCDVLGLQPAPNNGTLATIDFIMECPNVSGRDACISACAPGDTECPETCERRCPTGDQDGDDGLTSGEVAGVVVGSVVGVAIIAGGVMTVGSRKGEPSDLEEKLTQARCSGSRT